MQARRSGFGMIRSEISSQRKIPVTTSMLRNPPQEGLYVAFHVGRSGWQHDEDIRGAGIEAAIGQRPALEDDALVAAADGFLEGYALRGEIFAVRFRQEVHAAPSVVVFLPVKNRSVPRSRRSTFLSFAIRRSSGPGTLS